MLALTFRDPADYDMVREDDTISLGGLGSMRPGVPVRCTLEHSDGTSHTILLDHSYGEAQLEWFQAGSALNVLNT